MAVAESHRSMFHLHRVLIAVLVGAGRFAYANLLRGDRALHALLGMDRFPTDDTIRNLFRRFGMGQVSAVRAAGGMADAAFAAAPRRLHSSGSLLVGRRSG
jgi:hypothetical protein